MTLHDSDLSQVLAWTVELAERCDEAEREVEIQTRYSAYVMSRCLQTERERDQARRERDHARDLVARIAANQPVRPVPESLAEAVLGAECAVWIDGPG